jgi:hypothetical protein
MKAGGNSRGRHLDHHHWADMLSRLLSPVAPHTPALFQENRDVVLSIYVVAEGETQDRVYAKAMQAASSKAFQPTCLNR